MICLALVVRPPVLITRQITMILKTTTNSIVLFPKLKGNVLIFIMKFFISINLYEKKKLRLTHGVRPKPSRKTKSKGNHLKNLHNRIEIKNDYEQHHVPIRSSEKSSV